MRAREQVIYGSTARPTLWKLDRQIVILLFEISARKVPLRSSSPRRHPLGCIRALFHRSRQGGPNDGEAVVTLLRRHPIDLIWDSVL